MISVAQTQQASSLQDIWLRTVLTIAMTLPMLILYAIGTLGPFMIHDLHIQPGLLGYVTTSTFGLAAVLSLGAGPVVEFIGSRYGLVILFCAVALAYVLMIAAPGFSGIVAAVAVCGIAQALSNPVTNLLIAQRVNPKKKAFVAGLKQAGVQIGALFSGLVLPGIAIQFGWRFALGMIIPLALLLAVTAPSIAPQRQFGVSKGFKFKAPNRLLVQLMSIQCCAGMALSAFVTFLPLFATQSGVSSSQAGLMVAAFGVMGILSRVILTPFGARLRDESYLLFVLLVLSGLALIITSQANSLSHWQLWVGVVGIGLTAVATNSIAMGMILRDPAFGITTTASGLLSAAFFGGMAFGPPIFGAISTTAIGFPGAWDALVGVVALGGLMALVLSSIRRKAIQ